MSRLLPIAILLLLITGACRSGKNVSSELKDRYNAVQRGDNPADTVTMLGRGVEWGDISVPVSVNISRPSSMRIGGIMTMVNGRDINISLRMLGFEVGAIYVTTDSVYAYAKMQRVYVAESVTALFGGMNLSLSDLQALLIGSPVTIPAIISDTDIDMSVSQTTGQPLTISMSNPSSGRTASIAYTPLDGAPLAEEVAMSVVSGRSELAVSLSYDWSRAQVDKGSSKSFSIPKGYKRLSGEALLKSLGTK